MSAPTTKHVSIKGMTCGGCVSSVERALKKHPEVSSFQVDLKAGRAEVTGTISPAALVALVEGLGFEAAAP